MIVLFIIDKVFAFTVLYLFDLYRNIQIWTWLSKGTVLKI